MRSSDLKHTVIGGAVVSAGKSDYIKSPVKAGYNVHFSGFMKRVSRAAYDFLIDIIMDEKNIAFIIGKDSYFSALSYLNRASIKLADSARGYTGVCMRKKMASAGEAA